jgi:hypothetical protein
MAVSGQFLVTVVTFGVPPGLSQSELLLFGWGQIWLGGF